MAFGLLNAWLVAEDRTHRIFMAYVFPIKPKPPKANSKQWPGPSAPPRIMVTLEPLLLGDDLVESASITSRPADANFRQKLIDGNIFLYGYRLRNGKLAALPPDWNNLRERLEQKSKPASVRQYNEFCRAVVDAANKAAVKETVISVILKAVGPSHQALRDILLYQSGSYNG
jgi:hypothetical protein